MVALKALVFGMAGLIVVGMGLVVYGMMRQADGLRGAPDFIEASLPLPADCRLADASGDGRGLILLRLEGPLRDGCRAVLLFDPATGGLRGRIDLPAE